MVRGDPPIHGTTDFHYAAVGRWSQSCAAGDRGTVEFGEQRLALLKGIHLLRDSLRPKDASLDAGAGAARTQCHFTGEGTGCPRKRKGGRPRKTECRLRPRVAGD